MQISEEQRSIRDENIQKTKEWAEALRLLFQGSGVLGSAEDVVVPAGMIELFQVDDQKQLIKLIFRGLVRLPPDSKYKETLRNALGLGGDGLNLTERRNRFCKQKNVSYRTLIRHEEVGAQILAGSLFINHDELLDKKETLEQRVERLEKLVEELQGQVATLSK
ncbi:hypothetical protein QFZ70_001539 [Arthrobacter sp. V1I9]|uniref:hypothetical protein n=1 Tax=Arthrobacter sp. V1I9 TaxID=3042275 RepID=UPI0027943442|nr:hypothetical protein [Arthrobacter sp. V1I9]MDQ0869066.1 hypothetical protein [Arthrobacter sp. V1I9]